MDTDENDPSIALHSQSLTIDTVRMVPVKETGVLGAQLAKFHNKKAIVAKIKCSPKNLHRETNETERQTILIEILANDVNYFIYLYVIIIL